MEKHYEEILEPKRQRLKTMGARIHRAETGMERRIAELGDEDNPALRGLLKEKLAAEAKAQDVWVAERDVVLSEIEPKAVTGEAQAAIRVAVKCVRLKVKNLTYEQKRQLYEVLNLGIPREYGEGKQRQLRIACEIAAHKIIEFDGRSSCSTSYNTTMVLSTVIPYV